MHFQKNLPRRATCSKFQLTSTGPLCPARQVMLACPERDVLLLSAPALKRIWETEKRITAANSPLCACPLMHHPQLPSNLIFSWQQASCSLRESKLIAFIITVASHIPFDLTSIHLELSVLYSAGYYSFQKVKFLIV